MVSTSVFTASMVQAPRASAEPGDRSIFLQVREEVDLRKVLPPDPDTEEFDRYDLRHCIGPDHPDRAKSMLVYPDGLHCQGCGFKADAVDIYQLYHPELNKFQCAERLLSGDFKLEGEMVARELRQLDQDLAVRHHLQLAQTPEALAFLEGAFGFQKDAIRHFQLGWARVLVRLDPSKEDIPAGLPELEWREVKGKPVPYQWQWRFSVPVYSGGKLRQVIYRKADPANLGPKVTTEHNAGVWLYNADALKDADLVVLCEGWGDAIAFWQAGITAVTSTSGAGHFNLDWAPLLGRARRLYVVADADEAGRKMVERVRKQLPWARPLELPWAHGSKQDIRDLWLAGWRRNEFLKMLKAADVKARVWAVSRGR